LDDINQVESVESTGILPTHIYKILTGKPVEENIKRLHIFLWLPLNEISGNYNEISFKTINITGILSTHIFKSLAGKPVEENTKKYFLLMASPE